MLALPFQPGLTFHFNYMEFLRIFQPVCTRAENPSSVSETGLGFQTRAEIFSMWSPLSFQEDSFQNPRWNLSPANRADIRHIITP